MFASVISNVITRHLSALQEPDTYVSAPLLFAVLLSFFCCCICVLYIFRPRTFWSTTPAITYVNDSDRATEPEPRILPSHSGWLTCFSMSGHAVCMYKYIRLLTQLHLQQCSSQPANQASDCTDISCDVSFNQFNQT